MERTDVLIAGGGPTGLMLATELALAGVDVVVLERAPERSGQSKALNLQPRTAEVFDLRGLLDAALDKSIGKVPDGHFAGIPLSYEGWGTRHPYQVGIPQARTESVLEERLGSYGVEVRRGHELVGFEQDEDGVTATIRTPDGEQSVRAGYLVGCDGSRSAVRKRLGVGFPGSDGTGFGVVADLMLAGVSSEVPREWRSMRDVLSKRSGEDRGFGGLIPLGEPGLFRFLFGNRNKRPDDMRAPVADVEVVAELQKRYGEETEVTKVLWSSRFSDAARQADRYRVGRVLLAGDAAHIHFPAGGQGLNLGVQDAMNLGWKLAAEVQGRAPEGLLDSYESERHPVGARVLENVHAQKALFPQGPESSALRRLFVDLTENPVVARQLSGMVSGLDIRYEMDGPAHELLGARLPDVKLDVDGEQRWASELLHSGRGVLLTTQAHVSEQIDVVLVPELPGLDADALLVRPDGYVCRVGLAGVDAAITRWFG